MSTANVVSRSVVVLLGLSATLTIHGQQELIPTWEHTWPFGQESSPSGVNPAVWDNHVAVDPISSKVICTINDGLSTYSDMADLLYKFTSDGIDITGIPAPLGSWRSGSAFFNQNSTSAITYYNDRIFAHQYVVIPGVGSAANLILGGPLDSVKWVFGHRNMGALITGQKFIAADSSYVVYSGHDRLHCITTEGWHVWHKYVDAREMIIADGVLYASVEDEIQRIQLADGTSLSSLPWPGGYNSQLATDGSSNLFWAAQPTSTGPIHIAKRTLDGTVIWDNTLENVEGHHIQGLAIDGSGRAWVLIGRHPWQPWNGPDSHLWVVDEFNAFGPYTYHDRINDIAADDYMVYLTGRIDEVSDGTFLAAIETGLVTGINDVSRTDQSLTVRPNPASDHIILNGDLGSATADLFDDQGRSISTIQVRPSQPISVDLPNGVYFLRVGSEMVRFVVLR
jgi:hypothetical protein